MTVSEVDNFTYVNTFNRVSIIHPVEHIVKMNDENEGEATKFVMTFYKEISEGSYIVASKSEVIQ